MQSLYRSKFTKTIFIVAIMGLLGWTVVKIFLSGRKETKLEHGLTGLKAMHLPEGFTVERVAGPDLASYAMFGTLDDRGRLFLCVSSGNTLTNEEMSKNPDYSLRRLEDVDGDGIYDRSTVFAYKLTLPNGAVWYRGSLFVASPPDLIRLSDTDDDGVADQREVVATGWNLSSNAASLHGPFFGPDGWLYLADGRHGYKIKTKEGTVLEGKASGIWRCRPDGTGLEMVCGGGFDNPVEIIFMPTGETIGTMTYFTDPKAGQRDALMHWVEGGAYPKWHEVVKELKQTGDLMPVMTKFARIAPAGLLRYRGASFGSEYQGNLFSVQFNPHRVQRHKVFREGATFRTEDEDFLTSEDPDFHPTDVIEDADGSLLVIDTGAWFIHGCPVSRVAKQEIRGAVYRVRKIGAPKIEDPRGKDLKLETLSPIEWVQYLGDSRPAVRDKALESLVEAGEASIGPLATFRERAESAEVRCAAVFGLARIATPKAQEAVRAALSDPDFQVRVAATRAVGLAKDHRAVNRLIQMVLADDQPASRRQAATALGQIGDRRATATLLSASANPEDRFVEHSIIYALIGLKDPVPILQALDSHSARIRKAALIALDQMDRSPLKHKRVVPLLDDPDQDLSHAALWVVSHHSDWSGEILEFLRVRLRSPKLSIDQQQPVREVLVAFCSDGSIQDMVAGLLGELTMDPERKLFVLDVMDRCSLKKFPISWIQRLGEQLAADVDGRVRSRTVSLIRSRGIAGLDHELEKIATSQIETPDLRTAALAALIPRHPEIVGASFEFLLKQLRPEGDAALRMSAADILSRAKLHDPQLVVLARDYLQQADPLVLPSLLEAFRNARTEEVGGALVAALLKSPEVAKVIHGRHLQELLQNFSEKVRTSAGPLLALIQKEQEGRIERLRTLDSQLSGGDLARGRKVFFSQKTACSKCHTLGSEGREVGPDLTTVGAIRSRHDLLEAIVFPSASFVPGHEVYRLKTAQETYSGVIKSRTPEAVVLVTGPDSEVRIPREEIVSLQASKVSLMPDGFDQILSRAELVDLLAFLQAQK